MPTSRNIIQKNAAYGVVVFNSEYNDEGYDCTTKSVIVFDEKDNELVPIKGKEFEARENVPEFHNNQDYIEEPLDNMVVSLNVTFPELYVKE